MSQVTRLIKRTEVYLPVGNRTYRRIEKLEEVIKVPISEYIDLTVEVIDLTKDDQLPLSQRRLAANGLRLNIPSVFTFPPQVGAMERNTTNNLTALTVSTTSSNLGCENTPGCFPSTPKYTPTI